MMKKKKKFENRYEQRVTIFGQMRLENRFIINSDISLKYIRIFFRRVLQYINVQCTRNLVPTGICNDSLGFSEGL